MNFTLNNIAVCIDSTVNHETKISTIKHISKEDYDAICNSALSEGFELKEEYKKEFHCFSAYIKDEIGIFINYFSNADTITVCEEKNCRYFSYSDTQRKAIVLPEITQLHLEDFGMSYVIRLSDGRFIIIDGGWDLTPDAERLYDFLKSQTVNEKPIIAAWIFTHMHHDHYRCFNKFTELHLNDVLVEKFLFNFPKENKQKFDDEKDFQRAEIKENYSYENTSDRIHINLLFENIKLYNAQTYRPHTGQTYKIGDALLDFLACADDTIHFAEDDNSSSLVFKMELGGQKTLWTADASISDADLLLKYGKHLESDILQVPHHGFMAGDEKYHKRFYDLVNAETALLPLSDYNTYISIATYLEPSDYLMKHSKIKELITGDKTTTLSLPYHPPVNAECEFKAKYREGKTASGSKVWIFTGLNSSNINDFIFDILNPTYREAKISVELFFDNTSKKTRGMLISLPPYSTKTFNICDDTNVIQNQYHFNWNSVNIKGIPEKMLFAARFICETEFVVSNKNHIASYHS